MKRKEVEDVMGGPGAWDNVDQTEGEACFYQRHAFMLCSERLSDTLCSSMQGRKMRRIQGILLPGPDKKRRRAYDHVSQGVQITMSKSDNEAHSNDLVYDLRQEMDRELKSRVSISQESLERRSPINQQINWLSSSFIIRSYGLHHGQQSINISVAKLG